MSKRKLAKDYLERSKVRLKMLEFLKNEGAYADVVREAQEAERAITWAKEMFELVSLSLQF